ncbi:hypothetical protein HHJ78_07900 [Mobiluncus mulieris]|uniref:Uncharacterized protein n=1 Tax=Mobiluncus mulieris TaxID=2052 RepID=A0A7Y0Y4S6_9ACTO|nr:hypothetical protein [Mobiluncus mulieris]NMW65447.1 hypothetical protein [Mobiluncus mulieris]
MGDLINPGKTAPGVPNLGTPQPDSPEIANAHRYCAGQRTPTRLKFLPAKPRPKSRKTQPLGELLKRVRTCGGYATIYSLRNDGVTRVIACIKQESALPTNPTDMTEEPPSPDATIGAFIDYLATQDNGIIMHDTLPALPVMRVKSYGRSELVCT